MENLRGAALSESRFSMHVACHDKDVIMELCHVMHAFIICRFFFHSGSFTSIDLQNPLK